MNFTVQSPSRATAVSLFYTSRVRVRSCAPGSGPRGRGPRRQPPLRCWPRGKQGPLVHRSGSGEGPAWAATDATGDHLPRPRLRGRDDPRACSGRRPAVEGRHNPSELYLDLLCTQVCKQRERDCEWERCCSLCCRRMHAADVEHRPCI